MDRYETQVLNWSVERSIPTGLPPYVFDNIALYVNAVVLLERVEEVPCFFKIKVWHLHGTCNIERGYRKVFRA